MAVALSKVSHKSCCAWGKSADRPRILDMTDNKGGVSLIRVVIAHKLALVSAGAAALLEQIGGIAVAGQAGSASDLLRDLGVWRPDIVLLDMPLPGLGDSDLLSVLNRDFPHVRVIVLADGENADSSPGQNPIRVAGYLSKNTSFCELVLALKTVASEGTYHSPNIAPRLANPVGTQLTPRQTEVLEMIARGRSTKQIGQLLGISAKTVETHRAQITDRLAIHTLAGLVRYAIKTELIDLESK